MSQYRSNGNKGSKNLTETVLSIFISQTVCIMPHYFLLTRVQLQNVQLSTYLRSWFYMLRSNQCFCNRIILLMNQKTKSKKIMEIQKKDAVHKKETVTQMCSVKRVF